MNKTVLIIGGGLGGLFTGALLAKVGWRPVVLEKNRTLGGGLQTFVRAGEQFETGMHILGGLREGGCIRRICDFVGITDQMRIAAADADCMDSITYLAPRFTYRIPEGRDAFAAYFGELFPAERDNLRAYVDALYRLADEVDMFYLRRSDALRPHSEEFLVPADAFIARYIADERLRDVLAYMNPMYGGMKGHTPAYIHALINVLYIDGQSRFVGGSLQMAEALRNVIEAAGGRVVCGAEVSEIAVEEHAVKYVQTLDGTRFDDADAYVCTLHPAELVRLTTPEAFKKSYRTRLAALPNTYSAFTAYYIVRPQSVPYLNHTAYYQDDYGLVWEHGDYDPATWPRGFMFMTPADQPQQQWARKVIVNAIMPFSAAERWADTLTGRRGSEYEAWKAERLENITARMERLFPNFRASIEHAYTSSPLTIRDYYHTPQGALYGVRKDCDDIVRTQIPIFTKVRNLFLGGQSINLHGICGVPLTAIQTAEAVSGEQLLEQM